MRATSHLHAERKMALCGSHVGIKWYDLPIEPYIHERQKANRTKLITDYSSH